MKNYNIIVVFDESREKVLLCRRCKEPYKGLLNFVGGKIEPGEDHLQAAYRELWEETAIPRETIELFHFMDFTYYEGPGQPKVSVQLEVYVGGLKGPAAVKGTENELYWCDARENMFDTTRYAGEGNMGHIMELLKQLPGVDSLFSQEDSHK